VLKISDKGRLNIFNNIVSPALCLLRATGFIHFIDLKAYKKQQVSISDKCYI